MKFDNQQDVHTYDHSGIQERSGKVPLWLAVVYVALSAWAVYYLWACWSHA